MTTNCDRFVKVVVYYVIFSNILLPMMLLIIDDPFSCISLSDVLTAIVWIFSGVLLLTGTLQGKEKYVRFYVILTTFCLLVGPIYLVLYPKDVMACEKHNVVTMVLIVLYFIIMWPFQYCIYLFYKQLAADNEEPIELKEKDDFLIDKTQNPNQKYVV